MLDLNHQTIIAAVGDDKPASVLAAEKFAAAVAKLDQPTEAVDLHTATALSVSKVLAAAVEADVQAEHRRRHLDTLRRIATERIEAAWLSEIPDLESRFRAEFDEAAAELAKAVEELEPALSLGEVGNPHNRRYDRLRAVVHKLDRLQQIRNAYPRAGLTNYDEDRLTRVCVLKSSAEAVHFINKHGRNLSSGPGFWVALHHFPGVERICWQSSTEQQEQPGPARIREQDRQLREQFAARAALTGA